MSERVERHFVTLEGRWGVRQVHYRRAGSGPVLLMLHQSPQSSRELAPLMEQWGAHFTIVAPDSPGYGLSDPLGVDEAELSDFADATIEFMDAIGAGKFGIYGFHTGGMIGVAIAHGYPDRVSGFASNGVVVPTDQELDEILAGYLPRFEPRWDGGHLVWLWGRTRQQTIFFPWHSPSLAGRMDFPMPSPEHQQNGVCEFLRAADHYHVAYRAAFVFHAERVVPHLKVPGLITAAGWDPLAPHLSRLTAVPDCVQVVESETLAEASEQCLAHVRAHTGDELTAAPTTQPVPGRLWKQLVETAAGPVSVRCGGNDSAAPVVVLHGAGGSSATVASVADGLAGSRSVIVIDLPGHGESDDEPGPGGCTIAAGGAQVCAVLDALKIETADLVGVEGGAYVALEIAARFPERSGRLALVHPPEYSDEQADGMREFGMPSMAPDWFGGHLLRCWNMVRDSRLYFPWFRRDQAGIIWQEPELDDRRIQLEVTEFLKAEGAWQRLLSDELDYPFADKLAISGDKVTLFASPQGPWFAVTERAAAQAGRPFVELDSDPERWGVPLASALSA
jgi:pimeloyl-ACP methyl ester carboxylesterase